MALVGGEQSPAQAQAGAAIPFYPCEIGELGTAPNPPQNNQTAEIRMENLGKQKQLCQEWVKNKARRVWAVIPRLLWCLGIPMGTPRPGAEAGSVCLSGKAGHSPGTCPPPSSASAQLFPCFPAFLPLNFSCRHELGCRLQPHPSEGFGFQSCPSSAQLRSGAPGLLVQLPMCQPK